MRNKPTFYNIPEGKEEDPISIVKFFIDKNVYLDSKPIVIEQAQQLGKPNSEHSHQQARGSGPCCQPLIVKIESSDINLVQTSQEVVFEFVFCTCNGRGME